MDDDVSRVQVGSTVDNSAGTDGIDTPHLGMVVDEEASVYPANHQYCVCVCPIALAQALHSLA